MGYNSHQIKHSNNPGPIKWYLELLTGKRKQNLPNHKAIRHKNKIYLITLSDVNSTMWGSSISLGYQAACFRVREVELVKNLSAIGVVLKDNNFPTKHFVGLG